MSTSIDFEAAERLLEAAEFESIEPVWNSSNYVFIARLCAERGQDLLAVYKPRRGESPLWDFPDGTLFRREAAAYRLARILDWPIVPPTIVRDGPEGVGSLQLFVEHDPASHFFVQREDPELVPLLQRIAVFDAIANNADRKGGHCLLTPGGEIWGIDHGVSFHEEPKLRTVIWDWAGEPIPGEWLTAVRSALACLESRDAAAQSLAALLGPSEYAALVARTHRLLESGRFPAPGAHRPYPWPLI